MSSIRSSRRSGSSSATSTRILSTVTPLAGSLPVGALSGDGSCRPASSPRLPPPRDLPPPVLPSACVAVRERDGFPVGLHGHGDQLVRTAGRAAGSRVGLHRTSCHLARDTCGSHRATVLFN